VSCRARLDWLPERRGGRLILPDYKTCESAHREKFRKSAANYGYHQQADWYTGGAKVLELDEDPAFVFVAQEIQPPYLVNVIELAAPSLSVGHNLNYIARQIYAECVTNNRWPGYSDDVELVDLPEWYLRQHDEESED
jgi:hypothetical protein